MSVTNKKKQLQTRATVRKINARNGPKPADSQWYMQLTVRPHFNLTLETTQSSGCRFPLKWNDQIRSYACCIGSLWKLHNTCFKFLMRIFRTEMAKRSGLVILTGTQLAVNACPTKLKFNAAQLFSIIFIINAQQVMIDWIHYSRPVWPKYRISSRLMANFQTFRGLEDFFLIFQDFLDPREPCFHTMTRNGTKNAKKKMLERTKTVATAHATK